MQGIRHGGDVQAGQVGWCGRRRFSLSPLGPAARAQNSAQGIPPPFLVQSPCAEPHLREFFIQVVNQQRVQRLADCLREYACDGAALVLPLGGAVALGQVLGGVKMEAQNDPGPCQGHAMAYDVDGKKVVLLGGLRVTPREMLNDTGELDLVTSGLKASLWLKY